MALIIPAYNEEARLPETLPAAVEHLEGGDRSWEIRVVDDGSTDATAAVVEALAKDDLRTLGIQVNGKVRDQIELAVDAPEEEVKSLVLERPKIQKWTEGGTVKKFIYVPGRIINIAVAKK